MEEEEDQEEETKTKSKNKKKTKKKKVEKVLSASICVICGLFFCPQITQVDADEGYSFG